MRLTSTAKALKVDLKAAAKTCVFLGEYPSVQGYISQDGPCVGDKASPFKDKAESNYHTEEFTYDVVLRHLVLGEEIISEAYDIQRQMASQVVVYLISDLDRFWKEELPHAVPAMFFYRGYSMSMETTRQITEACKSACRSEDLDVIACSADGEFMPLMARGRSGNPQTQHQLSKDVWKDVSQMKKSEIIAEMTLDLEEFTIDKINSDKCRLIVYSKTGKLRMIKTPKRGWNRPIVQNEETAITNEANGDESTTTIDEEAPEDERIQVQDTKSNESNKVINEENGDGDAPTNNQPPEDENIEVQPSNTVLDYELMWKMLRQENQTKWTDNSLDKFVRMLRNALSMKAFTVPELRKLLTYIIRIQSMSHSAKISGMRKHELVNMLAEMVADGSKIEPTFVTRRKPIQKLKALALKVLMGKQYPKRVLNVAYCNYVWPEKLRMWKSKAKVADQIQIIGVCDDFEPYYVPDESVENDFEVFVYDKTHLGSNLRKVLCLDKVHGLSKSSWQKVSDKWPLLLNPTLLDVNDEGKIVDQMKEKYARNLFCKDVESKMRENCDVIEADFCKIVREGLYEADDMPGIPARDRCEMRIELIKWLKQGVDFGDFPPHGAFIKGMSTTLYEGLRSSSEAKLYLYALARKGTYCVRAPNTLCSESFFSTMQEMDPWGQGILTAEGVEKHVSDFTTMTALKMSNDRCVVVVIFQIILC